MELIFHWLWRLLPGNPMVVRIVSGGSRRTRDLWIRMVYLGALIGLVLIGLLRGGAMAGQPMSLSDLAKAGTWVFAVVAYGQVILVCLLAPLFMAGAISAEQSGKTYDILLTTPLSNLQIVLGSLAGRLFFVLALLASGLPLFAVLMIFGGVPITSVFVAFAVAGLTAVLVGVVAVTLSVLRAGGRKAVFVFVISIAAYLLGAYALDVVLLRPMTTGQTTTWLTPLHPLLVLQASLSTASYRPPTMASLAGLPWVVKFYLARPFATFAILSSTVSVVLVVFNAIVLRQMGQSESRLPLWLRRALRMREVGAVRVRPAREVGQNPIAWREANTRGKVAGGIIARWGFLVLGLIVGGVLLLVYHFGALPRVPNPATGQTYTPGELFQQALYALLLLEVAVITLAALYMAAGSVSREREDGTLDLMLTTPITPRMYIWGKLRGLVSFLSTMIAVPVLTLGMAAVYAVVGWWLGWPGAMVQVQTLSSSGGRLVNQPLLVEPETPVLFAIMFVPFIGLCVAAGMNWSLKAKGVLGAVVPSVAIIGALTLVLGFCGWNAAGAIPLVGPGINAFSPATNLAMLIDPFHRVSGFAEDPTFGRISLTVAAAAAAGGYSVVVYSLITGMVRGFDQTVRRLSGEG